MPVLTSFILLMNVFTSTTFISSCTMLASLLIISKIADSRQNRKIAFHFQQTNSDEIWCNALCLYS